MADLEDAIRAFPIVTWLTGHTAVRDGGGRNLYADCPVCSGKQKLQVRKETGRWRCFKCDEGGHAGEVWRGWGNLHGLISFLEKLSYGKAIRFLIERSGIPDVVLPKALVPERKIPKEAIPLAEVPKDHMSRTRLRERRLKHLTKHIYVCMDGEYAYRWILPCNYFGDLRGIEAKSYYPNIVPKALYPVWFQPQDTIYTTYEWDFELKLAIVTESIFDAETFRSNAVGLYGSNLLPGQLDRLLELKQRGVETLYWALDPDAFWKQSQAIHTKTSGLFKNYMLRFPEVTQGGDKADPNALGTDTCWGLLGAAEEVSSELDTLTLEVGNL